MSNLLKQTLKKGPPPKSVESDDSNHSEEEEDEIAELDDIDFPKKAPTDLSKYSPLSWKDYFELIDYVSYGIPVYYSKGDNEVIFFCIHGAGCSAASFCLLAKELKPFASLATYDLIGHGLNKHNGDVLDMSMESLVTGAMNVLEYLTSRFSDATFVIVGHSLGGSIASNLANKIHNGSMSTILKEKVVGLIVIDVSEGHAMNALPFMKNFVLSKPQKFDNVNSAVKYMMNSNTLHNIEAARVSTEPLLSEDSKIIKWKVDLMKTEKFWAEWFTDLNKNFLDCGLPKILILAHPDRMDKELTIAQMQGRFKLVVFKKEVGHHVHEDEPQETAKEFKEFLKVFRLPLNKEQQDHLKNVGVGFFKNNL